MEGAGKAGVVTHLLCTRHQRRVLVLDYVMVHSSDGQHCDSEKVAIGGHVRTPEELRHSWEPRAEALEVTP